MGPTGALGASHDTIGAMGFLFDSLVHLLSSEAEERERALARLLGRALGVAPVALGGGERRVWHFPKTGSRPYAWSVTFGEARCQLALSLADAMGDAPPALGLLHATSGQARGAVIGLPEGCLGRSSHRQAIVVDAAPFLDEAESYGQITGGAWDLVLPVTEREAAWVHVHGAEAFASAMREQGVPPCIDRVPGTTRLLGDEGA